MNIWELIHGVDEFFKSQKDKTGTLTIKVGGNIDDNELKEVCTAYPKLNIIYINDNLFIDNIF